MARKRSFKELQRSVLAQCKRLDRELNEKNVRVCSFHGIWASDNMRSKAFRAYCPICGHRMRTVTRTDVELEDMRRHSEGEVANG